MSVYGTSVRTYSNSIASANWGTITLTNEQSGVLTAEQAYLCMLADSEFIVKSIYNDNLQRFINGRWLFKSSFGSFQKWTDDSAIESFKEGITGSRRPFMNRGFIVFQDPNDILLKVLFPEGAEIVENINNHPFWRHSSNKEVV